MKRSFIQLVTSLAALAFFATGSAFAQNNKGGGATSTPTGPTIIPGGAFAAAYVITAPGSYILGGNRSSDGSVHVIEIKAPDVTLDLNGFVLSQTNPANNAGVFAANARNIEIRNGSISHTGIGIRGAFDLNSNAGFGIRVSKVRFTDSASGVNTSAVATQVDHCEVINCGVGISVGMGSAVTDCIVSGAAVIGVDLGSLCRLERTVIREAKWGVQAYAASVIDCTVSQCQTAFRTAAGTTLRNVDVMYNTLGIDVESFGTIIVGCRFGPNTTNFNGNYTNGGGNFIQ